MSSLYPNAIDGQGQIAVTVDNVTRIDAKLLNDIRSAIINIETELGTVPSRTYSNVKLRIDALETAIDNIDLSGITALDVRVTALEAEVIDLQNQIDGITPGGGTVDLNPETKILAMSNDYPIIFLTDGAGTITSSPHTITFPAAPENMLIKRLVSEGAGLDANDEFELVYPYIDEIRINGTAVTSAGQIIASAYGINKFNPVSLDIYMNAGDLLEIDVTPTNNRVLCSFAVTYEPSSASTTKPNTFVGLAGGIINSFSLLSLGAGAAAATNTLTVVSAPHADSQVNFSTFFGTHILYGAGGSRTSGSDDYDNTLGTVSAIATDIAAAINDGSNDFPFTASALGAVVTLTYDFTGEIGNFVSIESETTEVTAGTDYFVGGSAGANTTETFETIPADGTIKHIVINSTTIPSSSAGTAADGVFSIESLKINGGSNLLSNKFPNLTASVRNSRYSPNLNIPVSAGDVVTVELKNGYIVPLIISMSLIVELD